MAFTLWVIPILPTVYGEDEECATIPEKIRIWRDKATIMGEEKDKDAKSYLWGGQDLLKGSSQHLTNIP